MPKEELIQVSCQLRASMVQRIQRYAESQQMGRAAVIRQALLLGLRQIERKGGGAVQ